LIVFVKIIKKMTDNLKLFVEIGWKYPDS